MDYKESLSYLESLNVFGSKLGLLRILKLVELLDNPEKRYATIHVTGTNGKGSVSAMLAAILKHSGLKTGLYTSPHLFSYRERLVVDGKKASEDEFSEAIFAVKKAADQMLKEGLEQPTEFEVLTAAAFYHFSKKKVDYAVIEVGLGGLLDSTNVIEPKISIITNITMDHQDRCGGTLLGIARHKAGIIKEGVPVITAAESLALNLLKQKAAAKKADIFVLGEDFFALPVKKAAAALEFSFEQLGIKKVQYELSLGGVYQLKNAALAILAALFLSRENKAICRKTIADALRVVTWPGRFEKFILQDKTIIVDGAHNLAGTAALKESLDTYCQEQKRVYLLGILEDKDYRLMLKTLLARSDQVIITPPLSDRAGDPEKIARCALEITPKVEVITDTEKALDRALSLTDKKDILCLFGSLYLIGDLRRRLLARGARHGTWR